MKKKLIRMGALVLALCLLLPLSAFAASGKVYDVFVSITDVNSEGGPKTDTTVSCYLTMVSGDARMCEVLAQAILDRYDYMYRFDSPEMKRQMDEGLAIARVGGTNSSLEWDAYGDKYDIHDTYWCPYEDDLEDKLDKYDTTVYEVGPGEHIIRHYNEWEDDFKYGVTYTVTIIIYDHDYEQDNYYHVRLKNPDEVGGKTTFDKTIAWQGEEVHIYTHPDEGNMTYTVTVRAEDGSIVPTKYTGKGSYSFAMPRSDAEIDVVYHQAPSDPGETGVDEWLECDEHVPFMIGYPDGSFRPLNNITRAEVAMIFYRLMKNKDVEITAGFDDVADEAWYSLPVNVLASIGMVNGRGDGTFDPDAAITREEFVTICSRFANPASGTKVFTDVPEDVWYGGALNTCAAYGWVFGDADGAFRGGDPILRIEAASIVNRMLFRLGDREAIDGGENRRFTDIDDEFWGWYEVAEATYGHIHEDDEEFHRYYHEEWDGGTGTEYDLYKGTEGKENV